MSRVLLGLLVLSGCVHRYVEPAPTEPHALVHLRVLHHQVSGPQLDISTNLDGYAIQLDRRAFVEGAPVTRTVRMRPGPHALRLRSHFFHQTTRMETYTTQESYYCGSTYTPGYGGRGGYSTPQSCTRPVTRTRMVTVTVTDGLCGADIGLNPLVGASYLVQYNYLASGHCNLRCFRQIPEPNGGFQLLPCGPHEPPVSSGGRGTWAPSTSGGESPPPSEPAAPPAPSPAAGLAAP